ncbi:hypothetical protein CMI37_36530 [Candidatus Pacearchaeota archaeon]|nr:hypothetical protein [Candidatus Pacearchaeota archaeon]
MDKIGIIGNGFVGSAVAYGFGTSNHSCPEKCQVKIYDKNPQNSVDSFEDTVDSSDFLFVGVPTPPKDDWDIDLSIVDGVVREISEMSKDKIIVIKSTVLPGTCRSLSEKYGVRVVSNPEFLTERRAKWDFINSAQILIGADNPEDGEKVRGIYENRFTSVKYLMTNTVTTEFIKYLLNCYFSVRLSFLNEAKQVAEQIGADWDKAIQGFVGDSRAGDSHTNIPGPDGKPGFGGKCFPKDLQAFIHFIEKLGVDPLVMNGAWNKNIEVRGEPSYDY